MERHEHLLIIAAEECAEVHQRCSKALRFGMDEEQPGQSLTNAQRILQEFNDLVAVMEMVFHAPFDELVEQSEIKLKKEKVEKFLHYSESLGTLKTD